MQYSTALLGALVLLSGGHVEGRLRKDADSRPTARVSSTPTTSLGTLPMAVSEVHAENLLPKFTFMTGEVEGGDVKIAIGGGDSGPEPFVPADSCPAEIWDGASEDLRAPQLPHLSQDQWGCEREQQDVATQVLENEHLKVSITPQWGARLWSTYDKNRKRDWTFANPAHQPANIGVTKAWTAGGIEFNWSPGKIGHSVFSERPAFLGKIDTDRGPVLRAWEYDRRNATVWQVDIALVNDTLWLHPKITETTDKDQRGCVCLLLPFALML